jgi:hypothetical protein
MKRIQSKFPLFFFTTIVLNLNSQTFYKRYYETFGSGGNSGSGFAEGFNKTIIMSGYNNQNTANARNWQITRTDSAGTLLSSWQYDFNSTDDYDCYTKQTPDSGYVVYGQITSATAIMKINKTGAVQWCKSLTGAVTIYDILPLSDGSFMVGSPAGIGFGLIKMDAAGNILWRRTTNVTTAETKAVIMNNAGNFVCTGSDGSNVAIAEIDPNGNVMWSEKFTGINPSRGNYIVQTTDNGYAVACYQNGAHYELKIDQSGTLLWKNSIPVPSNNNVVGIVALPGNKTLISYSNVSNPNYLNLEEVNATGTSASDYRITSAITLYSFNFPLVLRTASGAIYVRGISNTGSMKMFDLVRVTANYSGCASAFIQTATPNAYNFATLGGGFPFINTLPSVTNLSPTFSVASTTTLQVCNINALASSINQTNALCNSLCNGSATVTATGGQAPYTYTWTPGGQNTYTVNNLCAGTYSVLVKDNLNNTYTQTVSITQPPALTLTTSSTSNTICAGASITLSANGSGGTGAITYTWQPGNITSSVTTVSPASSTAYTAIAKDANNCTTTSTQSITANPLPTITVNSGSICTGKSFTIIPGGASTYTIQGGSTVVSPGSSTSYTVAGTNTAGCVSSTFATSNVTVNATPTISVNSGSICSGNSFTIVPAGASTYTVQGGSTVVSPGSTTSYTVVGTSAAGCVSSAFATSNITVNATPTITANSGSICSGNSFTIVPGGASTYTIQGGSAVVSPGSTTSYTVIGTSTAGCLNSGFATSNVTVNTTPTVSMANGTICASGSFTLNANGANTFTYSSGPVVSPTSTTTYSVTGSSTAGCVSAMATAVVTVTNNIVVSITGTNTICSGQSAYLTANGASTYTWNTTATTSTIAPTPTNSTTYSVIGASGSCSNTAMINVTVNPLPTFTISSSHSLACVGQQFTLSSSNTSLPSYTWASVSSTVSGAGNNQRITSLNTTTTFTLIGISANGCTNSAVFTQSVSTCMGFDQISKEEFDLTVYPNPFNGIINISSDNKIEVEIFNILGSKIYTSVIENGKTEIDLSVQSKGIYFIKIGSVTRKIIKD